MAVLYGAVIGVALGLLGGGGSILAVPIFVYVLRADPKAAIAMSLAVVAVTSTIGAAGHWRAGNVNARVGAIFGAVALAATYVGARLSVYVPGMAQLTLLAVVMAAAAVIMLRERPAPDPRLPRAAPRLGVSALAGSALAVGGLTGLVGIGGGFLIVPALVALGMPMREAVGSSLAIIAVNGVVGFAGLAGRVAVDWRAVALVVAGTAPGIAVGVLLHPYVPQPRLRQAFSVLLLAVAGFMLLQQAELVLGAWLGPS
jgi:uncharacterized membrane protein YfcA